MSGGYRKVLVAVRDLDGHAAGLLQKATAVTATAGRIELLHVLTGPLSVAIAGVRQSPEVFAQAMQATTEGARARLERLARSRALASRNASVHVTADYPIADAIVRRAREIGADLIVGGTETHRFAARMLLANTDLELIREAPCPLLLVRPQGRYRRGAVIAAVDPFHAHDKPARLDARLLATARELARATGCDPHAFHAYVPLAALTSATMMQPVPAFPSARDEAEQRRRIGRRLDALAKRANIPASRRHLRTGDVALQLADVARRTRAQIVVMGALSRSGLKRIFIGNTAERVLDRLPCDLCVVKPRGFRSRVPRGAVRRSR